MKFRLYEFKYQANKLRERAVRKLVWALPREIIMWSAIRLMAHATTGKHSNQLVPKLTIVEALKRWDDK